MALSYAALGYEHREVELKHKPQALLDISPKGTVPVLQLPDGQVIDESLEIMHYALAQNDPNNWAAEAEQTQELISENDGNFKAALDKYKYSDRFPERSQSDYWRDGCEFLAKLEQRLQHQIFLLGRAITLADIAIFPFIRQWNGVADDALNGFPHLYNWLQNHQQSELFVSVMAKYPVWNAA